MFGIALGLFTTTYFASHDSFLRRLLAWAFGAGYRRHGQIARDIYLRIVGIEFSIHWMSPRKMLEMTEQRNKRLDIAQNLHELIRVLVENDQKLAENAQKTAENAENSEKIDEKPEKAAKPVYQRIDRDDEGFVAVDIQSSEARDMVSGENFAWVLDSIDKGVSLIVNDRELVNEIERSFTLPDYDDQESIGIGSIVLFGSKDSHVRARVTGYAQTPEGDRLYYYVVDVPASTTA